MEKNAIKKYAVWARTEMIARVAQKALSYGIAEGDILPATADSINGKLLTLSEMQQRQALIARIEAKGYEQVMEEVAYTWFNRFIALRFMEVNGYLPSMIRVFSNEENEFKPQILAEAINLELEGLDVDKVFALKDENREEELFRYLLTVQCNALSEYLPDMFQKIEDYTELLLPDNLLRQGSVIEQLVTQIPQKDWTDQVQIIGWLYQYYNAQKKDEVFAALKKNVKITKDNIPAATQLFTPDWIVRYMVENSLGRLWLEGHPNDDLREGWKYYLDEAEQEPDVQAQLDTIRAEYRNMDPTQIKVIDPCMGSGHILVYAFDVLLQIYEAEGWSTRDAVRSIIQNNLYGLDIDDRAAQLAYFAVMMKGCQYDKRFLKRRISPNVFAIAESGRTTPKGKREWVVSNATIDYFADGNEVLLKDAIAIREAMFDAKEYGSILTMPKVDFEAMKNRMDELWDEYSMYSEELMGAFWPMLRAAEALAQKYDVVVTNPPYMGGSGMSARLSDFVKKNYPDTKSDMSTVCMEKTLTMCKPNGFMAMINIPVWMFLSSYEKLRNRILRENTITNMVHPGRGIFGSDFGTTTFVITKHHVEGYKGTYRRLFDKQGEVEGIEAREQAFLSGKGHFVADQSNFSKIPGAPVAYWVSEVTYNSFVFGTHLSTIADLKQGMSTANNDLFLRFWHEVAVDSIGFGFTTPKDAKESRLMWFPHTKGGEMRKWYGNNEYVVNWYNDGEAIRNYPGSAPRSSQYYFRDGLCWSTLTAGIVSFRYQPPGFTMNTKGSICYLKNEANKWSVMGLLNSNVAMELLKLLAPTLDYSQGPVGRLPVLSVGENTTAVGDLVQANISLSRNDWDSFETSWDFQIHPLVKHASFSMQEMAEDRKHHVIDMNYIREAFTNWSNDCYIRFDQLKANEEELNRIFIDIYGLQDELTPEVEDKDVTVRKADLQRDIRSLISYAVGCMFGRYSLDEPGLAYAGGEWNPDKYLTFTPAKTNIIPICDDDYLDDDITTRFVEWVKTVYGADTLEDNLKFIADALGGKGQPREVIRHYFLNDFYADHLKVYQKRPIYWLFDSGKKNGFKALIYMHRYQPDTIARVRTDYVHELQSRYRTAIDNLEKRISGATTAERIRLSKRLKSLQDQAAEIHGYEEKIHHLADQMIPIDLDDGVKKNYEIFKDVLAKIK